MDLLKWFRHKPKSLPEPILYGRIGATTKPRASISAKIIRKNGKIENLGRLK